MKTKLFIFLLLFYVLKTAKSQNYQWLINHNGVSNAESNYTITAGPIQHYIDSIKDADTSIHGFLQGEKNFNRWKNYHSNRNYAEGIQIGGDIYASSYYGKKINDGQLVRCQSVGASNWTNIGPKNTNIANIGIVTAVLVHPQYPNIPTIYIGTQSSGVWYTNDDGLNWINLTDQLELPSIGISQIMFDPTDNNTILFASGSRGHAKIESYGYGIYKTTLQNSVHTKPELLFNINLENNKFKDFFIAKFLFHPQDNNVLFAIGTNIIYRVVRTNNIWQVNESVQVVMPGEQKYGSYSRHLKDMEIVFYNESNFNIFVSTFTHPTYYKNIPDHRARILKVNPTNLQTINTNPIFYIGDVNSHEITIELATTNDDPNVLYWVTGKMNGKVREDKGNFYKTDNTNNSTATKVAIKETLNHYMFGSQVFEISNNNKNIAFYGEGLLMFSHDFSSNANFQTVSEYSPSFNYNSVYSNTHADIRCFAEHHNQGNHYIFIGHDGGISRTSAHTNWPPSGSISTSWLNLNNNLSISTCFGLDVNLKNNNIIVGTQDNGNQLIIGETAYQKDRGDGAKVVISQNDPNNFVFAEVNGKIIKHTNIFTAQNTEETYQGFNKLQNSHVDGINKSQTIPIIADPLDDRNLWVGRNKLFKFNHAGASESEKFLKFPNCSTDAEIYLKCNIENNYISAFDISKSNPQVMFVAAEDADWNSTLSGKLFKSTDGGNNFTDISNKLIIAQKYLYEWCHVTSLIVHPENEDIVYLAFNNYVAGEGQGQTHKGINRVVRSIDGGETWTDISEGLPPLPVNVILFQLGTHEVLYAGNDWGVYRFNSALQNWECYNTGLPPVIVNDLKIDYCKNELICATWGRGVYKSPLPQEIYEITSSQTWETNTTHRFASNVIVKNNAVLTIKGNVAFGYDKWLQIEPGARVIVNGGKLYNECGTTWEGIHIAGSPNSSQTPSSNQGYLTLINAEIKNADVAVSTAALNANGTIDWNKTGGGIVVALNTNFKFNKRHVEFMSYKKTNKYTSYFTNCVFESEANKNLSQPPYFNNIGTMVTAWDVHGVTFTGCEFLNLNGNYEAEEHTTHRGTGIYLLDATVIVNGIIDVTNCNITKKGVFYDLKYGIEAHYAPSNTLAGRLMVSRQDFNINDRSVQIINGVAPTIFKNNFDLNVPSNYFSRAFSPYDLNEMRSGIGGVLTYGTAGALIEQNSFIFSHFSSFNPNEIIVSTVSDNTLSNGGGGIIRLNEINGTLIGAQTQQNNSALQFTCNQFAGSLNALKLNPLSTTMLTPGFGECDPNNQAKRTDYYNTFMSNSPFDATHYPNSTKTYVVEPGANDRPDPGKVIRVDVNDCILQGDVIPKEACIPNKSLNDWCHAEYEQPNPDKGGYINFKTRRDGIADSLHNELYNPQDIALAQSDYKYYNIEATQARNKVIWAYNVLAAIDSTVNYTDSIIAFLANETDVPSRKQLIATYYAKGDYANAGHYLSALPEGTAEIDQFKNYYNLLIAVASDERNIYQLNSEEITTLQSIAATQTSAALAAQGILTLVNGEVFEQVIERVDEEQLLTSAKSNLAQSDKWIEKNMRVYPNPANQSVVVGFELTSDEKGDETSIHLLDVTGKQIFTKKANGTKGLVEITTAGYSNGIYFIQLQRGGYIVATQKLIINH